MPLIYHRTSNYNGNFAHLNTVGTSTLNCRKIDLYRCAITVGNPSFLTREKIKKFGLARALYDSIIRKASLVACNIQSDLSGIRRHPIFESYVLDEKRIVSYNLGMAFGKFYSEKILGIPNLVHLEYLKKLGVVTFIPQSGNKTPEEPDLVGQTDDGKWHLFEAKGTSNKSKLRSKIAEAKTQLAQIATIHGKAPETSSACATYIGADQILTFLEDPTPDGTRALAINQQDFLEAYYSPFSVLASNLGRTTRTMKIGGLDVELLNIPESKFIQIGLAAEVSNAIREKRFGVIENIRAQARELSMKEDRDRDYSIGLDGFVVRYKKNINR